MLNVAWLMDWKERRGRRRAQAEARHLVARGPAHPARRRSDRIPEAVARDVEAAAVEVDRAVAARATTWSGCARRCGRLDEKMDEHLAFARKSSVREYAESIGVAVAIALLLRAFVVEAFQIPSGSMIPTLEIGDHIFVSKFSYGIGIPFTDRKLVQFGQPKRGDVIVFKLPARSRDRLHQAGGGAARREDRGPPERDLHQRQADAPRARPGALPLRGRPGRPGPERKCELWLEQLDGRQHSRLPGPEPGADAIRRRRWSRPATSS